MQLKSLRFSSFDKYMEEDSANCICGWYQHNRRWFRGYLSLEAISLLAVSDKRSRKAKILSWDWDSQDTKGHFHILEEVRCGYSRESRHVVIQAIRCIYGSNSEACTWTGGALWRPRTIYTASWKTELSHYHTTWHLICSQCSYPERAAWGTLESSGPGFLDIWREHLVVDYYFRIKVIKKLWVILMLIGQDLPKTGIAPLDIASYLMET